MLSIDLDSTLNKSYQHPSTELKKLMLLNTYKIKLVKTKSEETREYILEQHMEKKMDESNLLGTLCINMQIYSSEIHADCAT